jgi:hypothetical protein
MYGNTQRFGVENAPKNPDLEGHMRVQKVIVSFLTAATLLLAGVPTSFPIFRIAAPPDLRQ